MNYVRRYLVRAVEAVCILLLMMSVQGCDTVTDMAKKAAGQIAPGMDDGQATGIVITKGDEEAGQEQEAPVIILNTDDSPVITVENNIGDGTPGQSETGNAGDSGTSELPEEDIWDDGSKTYSMTAANREETSLAFIGDICFHDAYSNMAALRERAGGIYDCILPEVMEGLKAADILMANNEFPYSDRGTPTAGKQYAFRSKPSNVNLLHEIGVDIVSLANNHAYDHGPDALSDTVDILTDAKVPFVGAGKNIDEAVKPVYIRINGRTIAYTAATQIERQSNPDTKEATADSPGVLRTLDPTRYLKVIEEAAANSDFCVAYVHWGSENTDLVEKSQKDLAKKYAAAGADLIIGDHSHCLQGLDYVDGIPVIYSLGNFWFNSKTVDTGYLSVVLDENFSIKTIQFVPCVQEGCKTRKAEGDKKGAILSYLQGISDYVSIDEDGYITRSDTNHNKQNGQNTSPSRKKEEEQAADPAQVDPAAVLPAVPAL